MRKSTRLILVVSLVSFFAGLSLSAMAQQPANQPPAKKPVQKVAPVQPKRPAMPGKPPGALQQTNHNNLPQTNRSGLQQTSHGGTAQGTKPPGGMSQKRVVVGARGYRFGSHGVRRDIHTLNEREHFAWQHGGWRHERRFGRDGWWWEVNGASYWYAQPMDGPPAYVSEFEYVDEAPDVGAYPPPPPPPVVGGYPPSPPPRPPRRHSEAPSVALSLAGARRSTYWPGWRRGRRRAYRRSNWRGHWRRGRAAARVLLVAR